MVEPLDTEQHVVLSGYLLYMFLITCFYNAHSNRVEHDNIVKLFEMYDDGKNRVYLVMEL